ncbi:alpha-ketoglutarate-dependent dioxygenase alkB homolog 4 isoform X2 [Venturia canescens]|uniref:alpha-ketoglutarate-dependent dioxygenase alkB homolog 4 isoform X2 n=1 Tax=Venturia canescens TaxID=32260 RepID=UPI001C9BE91E|nr:alpha-ketoglutarate-dependent dioxygenase alkB homolog 4 isoform X2 [Venturia canescens]
METVRACGCKGIRTCLICEKEYNIAKPNGIDELKKAPCYVYCPDCEAVWPGWEVDELKSHPNHSGNPLAYPDLFRVNEFLEHRCTENFSNDFFNDKNENDFLTIDEAENLIKDLDALPWEASQSGRRKQNYGPKCNFKKRRLRTGDFDGFPVKTKFLQKRFSEHEILKDFQTIEQCSLEYTSKRGASIDPHIDDCWIWGERIVTVNVIGDSVLTMTKYKGSQKRYNLEDVPTYDPVVKVDSVNSQLGQLAEVPENSVVRLPMPARSLMVLYGSARYDWEHAVLREDVDSRRVCIAYREFTPPYLTDEENNEEAKNTLRKALNFW